MEHIEILAPCDKCNKNVDIFDLHEIKKENDFIYWCGDCLYDHIKTKLNNNKGK